MAKGLAPIFFTASGVVVAGVIGYSVFGPNATPETVPVLQVEKEPEIKAQPKIENEVVTKLETPKEDQANVEVIQPQPEETIEKIKPELLKPTFDVVRVEKDGSTVIAGEGPENEIVELMDGEEKLAETKVNSTGEFVFVLDKPLKPGAHELYLRVTPKEGDPIQSSSFAFVDIPKPNTIGEVTVLLAEAGKPSQVLQKPEIIQEEVAEEEVNQEELPEEEVAKVEQEEQVVVPQPSDVEEQETNADEETSVDEETTVVTATAEASVPLADPETPSQEVVEENSQEQNEVAIVEETAPEVVTDKPVEVEKLAPVLIEAADVEGGKIFIAGTGEPLTSINIYLDNELLGSAQVAENGAFLFEGSKQIAAGRYDIRADMTKGGASVLARAEVTLVHEPQVAAVEEPEEIIETTPEPEQKQEPEPEEVEALSSAVDETVAEDVAPENDPEPVNEEQTDVAIIEPKVEQAAEPEPEPKPKPEQVEAEVEKKEIQTGSAVIIRRGDNLWTVARRNYGAGIRYTTIFDANRDQVRDPHLIYPGQVLKIPESEQSAEQ